MPTRKWYYCENLDYIVYKYLTRLDIQQLTTNKWKKLIENPNILKDIKTCQQLKPADLDSINSIIDK